MIHHNQAPDYAPPSRLEREAENQTGYLQCLLSFQRIHTRLLRKAIHKCPQHVQIHLGQPHTKCVQTGHWLADPDKQPSELADLLRGYCKLRQLLPYRPQNYRIMIL
jgi:hypothetical protein